MSSYVAREDLAIIFRQQKITEKINHPSPRHKGWQTRVIDSSGLIILYSPPKIGLEYLLCAKGKGKVPPVCLSAEPVT